jgi:hypothetical protein
VAWLRSFPVADAPDQSLHTGLLLSQHVHCFLRPLQHCRAFHNPLFLRCNNTVLEHRVHDVGLKVVFEEFVLILSAMVD